MKIEKMKKFKDTQFMTGEEKYEILNDWTNFLKFKLNKTRFSKYLYRHLNLHCGFIAHYNIHGFYATYFNNVFTAIEFFRRFRQNKDLDGDFADLNNAMITEFDKSGKVALKNVAAMDDERFKVLELMVKNAKHDRVARAELIAKLF